MHRSILCLALFSASASAATPLDKHAGVIGSASLDGDRVDVPLFHGTNGSPVPMVSVTIGDGEYLMALRSSGSGVWVSDRVATDQGLTVKSGNKRLLNIRGKKGRYGLGGESKLAAVDALTIGGLTLTDVVVSTKAPDSMLSNAEANHPWNAMMTSRGNVDGSIGLEGLPDDVSWAIIPSTGIVSFSLDGASLIEGGMQLPVQQNASEVVQYATRDRVAYLAEELVVDAVTVGGVQMPARLEVGMAASAVLLPEKLPAELRHRPGTLTAAYVDIQTGDAALGTVPVTEFTAIKGLERANGAYIGSDVLGGFDIAMDRAAKIVTLKPTETVKRTSPFAFLIAQAMKAVQPEAADDGAASGADDGTASDVPGSAKAWNALVALHRADGDYDAALTAALNASSFDERDCAGWATVGRAQLETGDLDAAIAAYEKSAELYHAWYALTLDERTELAEEIGALDAEEKAAHEHAIASPSCHTSDGKVAALTLAKGDVLTVETLYRERLDLDPGLALVAGNALVAQGEWANAQEPLRQAMKMARGYRSATRLALAAVYSGQGDWESASALFDRVLATNQALQTVQFYLDAVTAVKGSEAAVAAAQNLASAYPDSAGAVYGLGYVAKAGGFSMNADSAREAGTAWFEAASKRAPQSASIAGARARWLAMWDPSALQTKKAIRAALTKDPLNKDALLAGAAVASAAGDQDKADALTLKAAQLGVNHIGYTALLSTLPQ